MVAVREEKLRKLVEQWRNQANRHEARTKAYDDPGFQNKHLAHALTYRSCADYLEGVLND